MEIHKASKTHAQAITQLIMTAMTDECCLYFAGPEHTLADFKSMMQQLVEAENTQYSYLNTLVATDGEGEVLGVSVSYDGARLHELRDAFIKAARQHFGRDFSDMPDETQAGELYLDSLAVAPAHRGKGIATALLKATARKAVEEGLPAVGLCVDTGNPKAERLYRRVGFVYKGDKMWGCHPMKHLQLDSGLAAMQ